MTDQVGRAITGADPVVWLNDTELTRRLLVDLGFPVVPVEKKVGYLVSNHYAAPEQTQSGIARYDQLSDFEVNALLLKKMVPWEAIDMARRSGVEMSVKTPRRTFTKDSGIIRYLDVSVVDIGHRLINILLSDGRLKSDHRVAHLNRYYVETPSLKLPYDHIVSTLPAPVFARVWNEVGWDMPSLHYCPVTFVISRCPPTRWSNEFAMVYDTDLDSPVSRVGSFGETWRYEFTGRLSDEALDGYIPVPEGVFVNPYGRIIQDVRLTPPENVTFLGRGAEWDYRGLIDVTLERVHGRR